MKTNSIPLSVLDLATVREGSNAAESFETSLRIAQTAEELGYKRFWLAEHHNMESIASSATAILIGFIAGNTKKIRVGSGGIMLPNHTPLIVAEQFGTLASLFPGRIDLGLGRAPGTDPLTARAIRKERIMAANNFPEDVRELLMYLSSENSASQVRAFPGEGLDIPVWILGSSTDSAYLAAMMGLPYAFASHFAPTYLHQANEIYRTSFKPSEFLQAPYFMPCVNITAADTDEEAEYLATSFKQLATGIISGKRKPLPPPVESMDNIWTDLEKAAVNQMLTYSFIGGPDKLKRTIKNFITETSADELMIVSHIYSEASKIYSYKLIAEILG